VSYRAKALRSPGLYYAPEGEHLCDGLGGLDSRR